MLVDMEEVMSRALAKAANEMTNYNKDAAMDAVDRWIGAATEDLATEILQGRATVAPQFARGSRTIQ